MRHKYLSCRCAPADQSLLDDFFCACILLLPTQEYVPDLSSVTTTEEATLPASMNLDDTSPSDLENSEVEETDSETDGDRNWDSIV